MEVSILLSLVGNFSIGITMIILARLSQRLGQVTQAREYYGWLYIAAGMVWVGVLVQVYLFARGIDGGLRLQQDILWVLLIKGLPALGVAIALVVAWHYWSWLLAERD